MGLPWLYGTATGLPWLHGAAMELYACHKAKSLPGASIASWYCESTAMGSHGAAMAEIAVGLPCRFHGTTM